MLKRVSADDPQSISWYPTLWMMVGVQFLMGAAMTVQSPIIPLFLPQIGVEQGGAVEFWSGVLNAINFLTAAVVSPMWGALADRTGRKVMVLRSCLAICVFMTLIGLADSLWQLVMLRGLMGAFSGFSVAAIALVASSAPQNRLGFALGWLSTAQLVGALFGPVMGGAVSDLSGSYRIAFFCTAGLAGVAAFVTLIAVKENFTPAIPELLRSKSRGWRALLGISGLLPLFGVLLISQFGVRAVQPVVTIFVQELTGPVPALATLAGFAFSITGLADIIASPFLGKRSDTIGYRRVLLISLLGAALATLPQAIVGEYWQFLALRFAVGMFLGGLLPTANALVARLVDPADRGRAFGFTATATFLGSFLGPMTGGSVAALEGVRTVFVVVGLFFLANFVWVYFAVPGDVKPLAEDEPSQPGDLATRSSVEVASDGATADQGGTPYVDLTADDHEGAERRPPDAA